MVGQSSPWPKVALIWMGKSGTETRVPLLMWPRMRDEPVERGPAPMGMTLLTLKVIVRAGIRVLKIWTMVADADAIAVAAAAAKKRSFVENDC